MVRAPHAHTVLEQRTNLVYFFETIQVAQHTKLKASPELLRGLYTQGDSERLRRNQQLVNICI